ncbi:MAG: aminoglycoside phosphotransferase family protein [Bacilli bacterium]|nr:aminoglycoside phosphotransferase family protein [Bacilli bacterium]
MNLEEYIVVEKINYGASSVEKYKLYKDNKYYLLRIFDARFMKSRYKALDNMEILLKNGIYVPKIYSKGLLTEEKGYALLEWIDGISLENKLTDIEKEIQYGADIAKELLKMHNINIPNNIIIYDRFIQSFTKKLTKVLDLEIDKESIILLHDFVMKHKNILKELKGNCIIHGDFHPGNIIFDGNRLVFIDMDVCTISHPWEDLTSNACNMKYPNFYSSVIENYFQNNIPMEFWNVYNLFGSLYILDYILYTLRSDGKSLFDGEQKLKEFLNFANYFQSDIPKWFNKDVNVRRKV